MFGIGTGELLIIAIIALLLFPPHELPKMLRSAAKAWGTVRRTADEFKDAIMQEEAMKEVQDAYHGAKKDLRKAEADARRELMKARMEARKAEQKLLKAARDREAAARDAEAKKNELGEGDQNQASGEAPGEDTPSAEGAVGPAGTQPASTPAQPVPPSAPPSRPPSSEAARPAATPEPARSPVPPPPATRPASPGFPPPKSPDRSGGSRGQGAA